MSRPICLCIFRLRIEAGTGLRDVRQVTVTEDMCLGIFPSELFQQPFQGDLLLRGTCVGGFAVGCQSAFVADADRVLVVAPGMGTDELFVAGVIHRAVLGDVVVVAGEPEAGIMAGYQVLQGKPPVAPRRRAVNHDKFYCSHSLHTTGDGSGADDGGQYGNDDLNDGFPSVIFHKFLRN